MNFFEKILFSLQKTMERPIPYGWYHLLCICLSIIFIIILYIRRKNYNDKQLKIVLGTYGIITLVLELLKQLIWSFNFDVTTGIVTWDYTWYAAPFQFCTTPMYTSIICLFLKKNKLRDSLLSYIAFYTILGSIMTILIPDSCFTSEILINIHTMFLHCGSLVVSVYLLFNKEVKLDFKNLLNGFYIFIIYVFIANSLNIIFYNLNIIGDETFNMFYISPYFISSLPIYNVIQEKFPYLIFLSIYIVSIYLGASIIYIIVYFIEEITIKLKKI